MTVNPPSRVQARPAVVRPRRQARQPADEPVKECERCPLGERARDAALMILPRHRDGRMLSPRRMLFSYGARTRGTVSRWREPCCRRIDPSPSALLAPRSRALQSRASCGSEYLPGQGAALSRAFSPAPMRGSGVMREMVPEGPAAIPANVRTRLHDRDFEASPATCASDPGDSRGVFGLGDNCRGSGSGVTPVLDRAAAAL